MLLALVALLQVALEVTALVDLYRRPKDRVVGGNKWVWVAVILLVNLIGAILYFALARKPAVVEQQAREEGPPGRTQDVLDSLYGPTRDDGTE